MTHRCPHCRGKIEITLAQEDYDDTNQACESCEVVHDIEVMTNSGDGCWFCPACVAAWNEAEAVP